MELEDYLQSHLYRPGPVLLQEDHAEVRAAQISRREAELGPVEEIKDLCTELDSHLLSYRRVLKDGDILARSGSMRASEMRGAFPKRKGAGELQAAEFK